MLSLHRILTSALFILTITPALHAQGSWMQVPTAHQSSPATFVPVRSMVSVAMRDTGSGIAVGYTDIANGISGVLKKLSGDPTWYIIPVSKFHGLPPSHQLWAGVWVLGDDVWICGSEGRIYRSSDFGDNWNTTNSGISTTSTLRDIQIVNLRPFVALEGFVVGDNGALYYTDTGGASWVPDALPATVPVGTDLHALSWAGLGGNGYWFTAGEGHTFLRINRALSWPTDDLTLNLPAYLGTIHEINVRNGDMVSVVGEALTGGPLHFSPGGGNVFTNRSAGLPTGDFRAVFMGATTDTMGWVGGPGPSMYYSLNHGYNWTLGTITPLLGRTLSGGVQDIHGHFVDYSQPNNWTNWESAHAVGGPDGPSSEGWVLKYYPEVPPDISATSTSFDFGTFTCGPSLIRPFTVQNNGAGELEITSIFFSLPEFSLASPPPDVVAPYDRASFNIRWTPTQPGPAPTQAKMTIVSNDPVYPTWEVDLAGLFNHATLAVVNPTVVPAMCAGDSVDITVQATISGNIDPKFLGMTHVSGAAGMRLVSPDTGTILTSPAVFTFRHASSTLGPWTANYRLLYGDTLCPDGVDVVFNGSVDGSKLMPSPSIIDFGPVCVGQNRDMTLTLTNNGSLAGSVVSYTCMGERDAFPGQFTLPVGPIAPSANSQLLLRFAPSGTDLGPIETVYKLAVHPCGDSVTITLRGIAVRPQIGFSPAGVLAIDPVLVGQSVDLPVTIANNGSESVTITRVSVSPPQPKLTINGLPTFPRVLAASSSFPITLHFAPEKPESILASLVVHYSTPCADSTSSMITASSTEPPTILVDSLLDMGENICPGALVDSLWVKNLGPGQLTLKNFAFSGRDASHFSVLSPAVPAYVQTGDSVCVRIACSSPSPGVSEANLTISHNDPKTSNISVIRLRAERIDVGWKLEGDSTSTMETCARVPVRRSYTIRNTGTRPRTLTGLHVTDGAASFGVLAPVLPLLLNPGDAASFEVQFTPGSKGAFQGKLEISVGPCGEVHVLSLHGTGRQAELSLSPSPLNFGAIDVGRDSTLALHASNSSGEAVRVADIIFRPPMPVGSGHFTHDAASALPFVLAPGNGRDIGVHFTPRGVRSYTGSLCVVTDDPCPDTICIMVTGRGTSTGLGLSGTQLDILLDPCTLSEGCDSVALINNGSSQVTIIDAVCDDPAWFAVHTATTMPFALAPGDAVSFRICAHSGFTGTRSSILRIATSDAALPELQVDLIALRDSSSFRVTESGVDFGSIIRCEIGAAMTVTLVNDGLLAESIDTSGIDAPFSVGTILPLTLQPGDQDFVTVRFSPVAYGVFVDTLYFVSARCGKRIARPLRGEYLETNTWVAPDPLIFTDVPAGTDEVRDLSFRLTHLPELRVAALRIEPSGVFTPLGGYPKTVQRDSTLLLPVRFAPPSQGTHHATACLIIEYPCADTICVALEGSTGGGGLAASPARLDFGDVAQCEQPVLRDTVRNRGGAAIHLTASRVEGAAASFFELLNGIAGDETLNPGTERVFEIRMNPAAAADGALDARLVIENSAIPAQFEIPLTARRVTLTADPGSSIDLGIVYAGATTVRRVTLRNSGSAPLRYDALLATPGIAVSPSLPITIQPGDTADVDVLYTPSTSGPVDADALLLVATPCADTTAFRIRADVRPGVTAGGLTLGVVPSCTQAYGSVMLRNHLGEAVQLTALAPVGADPSSVSVVSPASLPVGIAAGDSLEVLVEFTASAGADRSYAAEIEATLRASSFDLHVKAPVTAYAHSGRLDGFTSSDFGQVDIRGGSATRYCTFTNTAPFDVRVANPRVTGSAFSFIGATPALPLTLRSGDTVTVQITFTPTVPGTVAGGLILEGVLPCAWTDTLALTGEGVDRRLPVSVSIPGVEGKPDDIVDIPIRIDRSLAGIVTEWSGDVSFNASMLYPLELRLAGTLSDGMRQQEFSYEQSAGLLHLRVGGGALRAGTGEIAVVRALVLIGNDVRTPLHIAESFSLGSGVDVEQRIDGEFRLTGYCDADGRRLVEDRGGFRILAVAPDPSSGGIAITYESDNGGVVDVRLYDLIGREQRRMAVDSPDAGIHTITLQSAELPAGVYLCVLRLAGRVATGRIIKMK